mgnify:CR=1 FL=1
MICTKIIIRSNSEAATGNVMGARAAAGGFMKKGFLANIGKSAMINGTPLGKGMDKVFSGREQAKAATERQTVSIFKATHNSDGSRIQDNK